MVKEIITIGNTEVEKHIFYQYKNPIWINEVDTGKIVVFNNVPFGIKVFPWDVPEGHLKVLTFGI